MDTTELHLVDHQPFLGSTSSQYFEKLRERSLYWTAIDNTPRSEQDNVRVFPGNKVPKLMKNQIQFHEKIGEGVQGEVFNAKLLSQPSVNGINQKTMTINENCVVKKFKGKLHENHFGQWPEELFGTQSSYVCVFYGYSNDEDSFCLLMDKYDCSLRGNIDKQMEKGTYKGRPFKGPVAMSIIIQIAVGMSYLHQLNIIHRDLKADNIFVRNISKDNDIPAGVYIGDFDVAPTVIGTLFWRAPEILQALRENINLYNTGSMNKIAYKASKRALPFTTKSDVYSFGMVCYEILTGGIPLEKVKSCDIDVVLSGERPKLPSNLNSKMVDLLNRCWHHDPDARPTFKEIVVELKGFVEGTKVLMQLFNLPNSYRNVGASNVELSFVELKQLVHVLVDKYKQEDFVILACQLAVAIEQFEVQFGMQSFKEHPSLPFYKGFSRMVLFNTISLKRNLFMAACPQVLPEFVQLCRLIKLIIHDTIGHDISECAASHGRSIDIPENLTQEEGAKIIAMYKAFFKDQEIQRQSCVYVNRHKVCHELLTNKHHIGRDHDEIQPCVFCKNLSFYAPESSDFKIVTFQLYTEKFATLKSCFAMTH